MAENNEDTVNTLENIDASFIGFFTPSSEVLLQKTTPVIAMVYGKIWLLSKTIGYCYMSRKTIAKQLGITIRTLDIAIQTLLGEPVVGYGKQKKPNSYFNKTTRWIADVTPENYLSDYQVRYYCPIQSNIVGYVSKWEIKKQDEFQLTAEQKAEIEKKTKVANTSNKVLNTHNEVLNTQSEVANTSLPITNTCDEVLDSQNEVASRYKDTINILPEDTIPNKLPKEKEIYEITYTDENSKSIEFSSATITNLDSSLSWGKPEPKESDIGNEDSEPKSSETKREDDELNNDVNEKPLGYFEPDDDLLKDDNSSKSLPESELKEDLAESLKISTGKNVNTYDELKALYNL
jgi:hypothetical protein